MIRRSRTAGLTAGPMTYLVTCLVTCLLAGLARPVTAQVTADSADLRHSIEQLRSAIGTWDVATEFLAADGSVARRARGTYRFEWVVPDRVIQGRSEIPEFGQASVILFYVSATRRVIEMVSVGGDGTPWVMTGPLGGEVRTTPDVATADGGRTRLRFTRSNVTADAFESRMEVSSDGGVTWRPGNHQVFRRAAPGRP